ncbi:MAG: methylated-DNA--[protein]-cysteine S-methyltransferase [Candidatus Latescibacteria bacterium]|nr:methylated-DNA--[protein]-cysteine S-methyltransferase [Candidatus Latescibacterota bacterium]
MSDRLEVATARVDSEFGSVWILATQAGLRGVGLGDREAPSAREARALGIHYVNRPRWTDGARRALEDYFAGREPALDLRLDLAEGTPFERRVWDATRRVRYGSVISYGALAARIDMPGAARATGNALGKNPAPIVIPCHRVIQGDLTIGGFSSGLGWKRYLLELERGQLELGWERVRRSRNA